MLKTVYLEGVGEVVLARRRGTRSLRLSISGDTVRLGMPYLVSEKQAIKFLHSKADWIAEHRKQSLFLANDSRVGRAHQLIFEPGTSQKVTTKVINNQIRVRLPNSVDESSAQAQTAAKKAARKALLAEAKSLLPQRIENLAQHFGYSYKNLSIKFMKSRWGSCTARNELTLNAYLIQLPWELIDYVICHELAHTKNHNHSSSFWSELFQMQPNYKDKRKLLKTYNTDIIST